MTEIHLRATNANSRPAVRRLPSPDPVPAADPADPHRVYPTHLLKEQLGKSRGSCKLSLLLRPHRRAMIQEFWCASYEEACCLKLVTANGNVETIREQWTRIGYVDRAGVSRTTLVDTHVWLRDGAQVLLSVKYRDKARRRSYLEEIAYVGAQCVPEIADRFVVVSRESWHPLYRAKAEAIHRARRGWDPEADDCVLESSDGLGSSFRLGDLLLKSGIGARGMNAAMRLVADGEIGMDALDPFDDATICWRVAA